MPSEFELIRRYFCASEVSAKQVSIPIGDDCAVLGKMPRQQSLAISTDTLLAGVHFPEAAKPELIASRSLRASISDLAAMGAAAYGFTLALTLPAFNESWVKDFAAGLLETARLFSIPLVGGDTTRGPLSLTVTVLGSVANEKALRRNGAQVGDGIFVNGTLGDSAAALQLLSNNTLEQDEFLHGRYFEPHIDLELGQLLSRYANSAIDVSDGLLADLHHITVASDVNAELQLDKLPYSPSCLRVAQTSEQAQLWALTGGDDYRLCFTMPSKHIDQPALAAAGLHQIGHIRSGAGLRLLNAAGREQALPDALGYDHGR